ncbi:MAG: S-layer homology domain-containing protein [Oscillospiraceae bacterium]|nr:S-layer homology domain-containing protein [Oscillospiraceae bacterium]
MKKRIISLLLVLAFVAVLVPQMATGASAAQQLTAAPYAPVEYKYSPRAQAGTIRFVAQLTMSSYFYEDYWGPYASYAGHECLTACVSMALSYVGVSATPAQLGDYWNAKGYTGGVPFSTTQWDTQAFGGTYIKTSLDTAMKNYLNGGGKYSPAVIHLTSYSANGHWVMVAGKVNANTYLIVDPANDRPWTMTVSDGDVFYQRDGSDRTEPLTEVFQYYNGNASVSLSAKTHTDGTVCPSTAYKDMPEETNWAHKGIDYCVDRGLMNGVDSSHFQPSAQMTRAMLVTVLYRAAGCPSVSARVPFTDLTDDWYYNAVAWAYSTGVTSGTTANRFDPNGTVTREQLVAMLYRFKAMQTGASNANLSVINGYQDNASVSDWAKAAFCWAVDGGIINGVGNQLQPQSCADRAQIATILMRYMQA